MICRNQLEVLDVMAKPAFSMLCRQVHHRRSSCSLLFVFGKRYLGEEVQWSRQKVDIYLTKELYSVQIPRIAHPHHHTHPSSFLCIVQSIRHLSYIHFFFDIPNTSLANCKLCATPLHLLPPSREVLLLSPIIFNWNSNIFVEHIIYTKKACRKITIKNIQK